MSYDVEVTWSGAELQLDTTKRIHITYKPATIDKVAWDTAEASADEARKATLTTKDLPDATKAAIEVYRSVSEIKDVKAVGASEFEKAMKILVETLKVPDGASVTIEIYRKAEAACGGHPPEATAQS